MAEKDSSSMNNPVSIMADTIDQERKDISKVFSLIRSKLNEKEKELLELQRRDPSLLAPDSDQIDHLFNVISSIHLSTSDGSFLFPSTSENSSSTLTSVQTTGVQSIKTLPNNVWLNERKAISEDDTPALRLPLVSQLFSMPTKAFLASSSTCSSIVSSPSAPSSSSSSSSSHQTKDDQPVNRLPMVQQLLSMPLDAFKPSKQSQSSIPTPIEVLPPKTSPIVEKSAQPSNESTTMKSILDGESIYSKEFWLKKPSSTAVTTESTTFDVEKYIQQTSEKMRRLHLDYVAALNQLQTSPISTDASSTIKSIYPQVFERIQPELPSRGRIPPSSSKK